MRHARLAMSCCLLLAAGCAPEGGLPTATGGDGAIARRNPFGVPTRVSVDLPRALGGSGIIATGGGNIISTGGGNYRALAEGDRFAPIVTDNVKLYKDSTKLIETILQAVAKAKPAPGRSYTFPDPDKPGKQLTVLLEVEPDQALISIGRGDKAKGDGQMISIAYTSAKRGRAVLRSPEGESDEGTIRFATTYDLEAGSASAEGILDATMTDKPSRERIAGHWEFESQPAAKADEVAFRMQVAAHVHRPSKPEEDGHGAVTAQFLPDGHGAFILGFQNAGTGGRFLFMPADGVSWGQADAPHAFYLDAEGHDLPAEKAGAALQAIAPADDTIYRPFPGDPAEGDPFAGRLDFPAKAP